MQFMMNVHHSNLIHPEEEHNSPALLEQTQQLQDMNKITKNLSQPNHPKASDLKASNFPHDTSTSTSTSTVDKSNSNYDPAQPKSYKIVSKIFPKGKENMLRHSKYPDDATIVDLYGPSPIIEGLDTCADFRKTVPLNQRFVAPAGMFNSGTHLLYELLYRNCQIGKGAENLHGDHPIQDGVAWGKHIPETWREEWTMRPSKEKHGERRTPPDVGFAERRHAARFGFGKKQKHKQQMQTERYPSVDKSRVLPVVVVKDPYTWMQSMCRHPYQMLWQHDPDHCPNLVPNEIEVQHKMVSSINDFPDGIPVSVTYRVDSYFTHHSSMAGLWNDWYSAYNDATDYPRLMVRFEDLLFRPESVIGDVCKCAGGNLKGKFQVIQNSAKPKHAGSSDLETAVRRYGDKQKRIEKFTQRDIDAARTFLNVDLMNKFGYKIPGTQS